MDNCLFRVLSHKNILDEGYKYPALRLTGYGSYQNSFSEMARGYKKAADILAATQTDRGANSDDSLLFPIMFSYRQAAELRLKAILMNCVTPFNRSRTLGERGKEAAMIKTHSLSKLLMSIKTSVDAHGLSSEYYSILKDVKPYIDAFNSIDSHSLEMRYPVDTNLYAGTYQQEPTGFDIQYTYERFQMFWIIMDNLYAQSQKDWISCRFTY